MILKKQVSFSKFVRIMNNANTIPCHSFRAVKSKYEPECALESYLLGDYVYAVFKCKVQRSNRLSTHCVRYWVGDHHRADWFSFNKQVVVKF